MATGSSIEWTEATWNPVTGCDKISPGCKHCYAERMAKRLQAMGQANYRNGFTLTLQPHMLELPIRWKKPSTIFVNSMSDLFHKDVPTDFIQQVFGVMRKAHWHQFQALTKRADRVARLDCELDWAPNIWMGTRGEPMSIDEAKRFILMASLHCYRDSASSASMLRLFAVDPRLHGAGPRTTPRPVRLRRHRGPGSA